VAGARRTRAADAGQKVFIQAGSGGVGTFAIQLAKHLGATVATTTSTSNVDLVRGLGADVIVDYKTEDFESKLSGYDLVLHSQDGKALEKSLRVLRPGGRLVSISGPPDPDFAAGAPSALVREALRAPPELRRAAKGEEARHHVLLPLHEGERRSAAADRER
jgi:NADPH:quinone reductase-like Zn-dependent oxidoreductase